MFVIAVYVYLKYSVVLRVDMSSGSNVDIQTSLLATGFPFLSFAPSESGAPSKHRTSSSYRLRLRGITRLNFSLSPSRSEVSPWRFGNQEPTGTSESGALSQKGLN
ncbi:uncharacterized protein LAJ45_02587 [Morchella importuna]|uniref:uncharacterized protein n=1 Tax=Morchella importuna TaxID=1174673 RepID=UPI001E8CA2D1|nr:uncharacterized protein LAJ45_02587 [Morchella importuna]KAH8153000.1 hypothetical protein LAJ45_02587 [Morchella importuna]